MNYLQMTMYFSSTSKNMVRAFKKYVESAIKTLKLDQKSYVVEIASNDGYLLQYLLKRNIPCLGIEPTHATAEVARARGIETLEEFFGSDLAQKLQPADLIIANNVLAHVPNINDFVLGIKYLLKESGVASFEFPHLLELIQGCQFDTIYHEHYSYLSLSVVTRIFEKVGLDVFKVEQIQTHGGSLRVWTCHKGARDIHESVPALQLIEQQNRLETASIYSNFQALSLKIKTSLMKYLLDAHDRGKIVVGYGAAAKGNTLLNYAGIKEDLLPAVVDLAPSKQGKYLPGSHIPIIKPSDIDQYKPDELLVLPWNLAEEIKKHFPERTLIAAIPKIRKL